MPETRALLRRLLRAVPAPAAPRSVHSPDAVTTLPLRGPRCEPASLARLDEAMVHVTEAQAQLAAATAQLDALRRELLWERQGFDPPVRPREVVAG